MGLETVKNEMHPYAPLRIVDCRTAGWSKKVVAEADTRRNFIVILKSSADLEELNLLLDSGESKPEKLERWGIHALADVLEIKDYSMLLTLYSKFDIRLIEQLKLSRNKPPRVKPHLLYCEVRGIISDHSSLEEAGESLLDYLDSFKRAKIFPLAGLYAFRNGKWVRMRKLF